MELSLRTFEAMQYFLYYDTEDINIIRQRIENLTQLQEYALIIHDKDIDENGKLKDKHFHIVVRLKNQMTITQISNTLKLENQYINKIKTTTRKAYEYLIHKNDKDKYQYSENDVLSNFDYQKYILTEIKKENEKNKLKTLLDGIATGEIKQYNIVNKCDIETFTKYKTMIDRAFQYRQQKIQSENRNMNCIYIYGQSGVGKTTYAKKIAELYNYKSIYISSGGDKLFDDYQGQDVAILDDIRGDVISITDLLKLLDNNTNSLVGCRYYNKSIYECKLIILTSTIGPMGFFEKCKNSTNEDVKQLIRRLSIIIEMTNDRINYHSFQNKEGIDKQLKSIPNTIKKYYDFVNKEKEQNTMIDKLSNFEFNGI